MLLVGRYRFCFWIICHGSHRCEKMSCKCERLKNIVIRGSVKVYSMHFINNHLYSILKLGEESKNIYKLTHLYMVGRYTLYGLKRDKSTQGILGWPAGLRSTLGH